MNGLLLSLETRLVKAIAHPTRLEILHIITEGGPRCVCELIPALGLDQSNVSQHLAILRQAGVLSAQRDGTRVVYSLANPKMAGVLEAVTAAVNHSLSEMASLSRKPKKSNKRAAGASGEPASKSDPHLCDPHLYEE